MDAVYCISALVFVLYFANNVKLFLDYLRWWMMGLKQVDTIS